MSPTPLPGVPWTSGVDDMTTAVAAANVAAAAAVSQLTATQVKSYAASENVNTITPSANYGLPAVTSYTMHIITLTANRTIFMPTAVAGASITVYTIQDGTGGRVPTFSSVKFGSGVQPTGSSLANKVDVWTFTCADGSTWQGFLAGVDLR